LRRILKENRQFQPNLILSKNDKIQIKSKNWNVTRFKSKCMFTFDHFLLLSSMRKIRKYVSCVVIAKLNLWQQATIEVTRRDISVIACLRHIYFCVALHAHPVRGA